MSKALVAVHRSTGMGISPGLPIHWRHECNSSSQDIDKLCTECASLIDNHDKIKDLSAVHYNLGKTLQDVENIVALPQQAAEAEDMLKDNTQLSEVPKMSSSLRSTGR